MLIAFPGFPSKISDRVHQFPDPAAILREPILAFAPAEWVRTHGSPFQRQLLDAAPLANRNKHVLVSTQVRVAIPGLQLNKIEFPERGSERNEWHVDLFGESEAKVHVIANTLGTEFNTQPVTIDVPRERDLSYRWFCEQSLLHAEQWKLVGAPAPGGRFVTFDRHIHRAPLATKIELRYFLRFLETDELLNQSGSFRVASTCLWDGNRPVVNVEQHADGRVTVHYPDQRSAQAGGEPV